MTKKKTTNPLREECLSHCAALGIPLESAALDEVLSKAEKQGFSHLQFLDLLLGAQAGARRERSIARRIREARFAESKTARLRRYASPDWLIIDECEVVRNVELTRARPGMAGLASS